MSPPSPLEQPHPPLAAAPPSPSPPPSISASSSSTYSRPSSGATSDSIFPPEVWGTRATEHSRPHNPTPTMATTGKLADRLRAVALTDTELPPALPESPEVIMRSNRPLPLVPNEGTRPGPALGLALGSPANPITMSSGLPTPPADSPKSSWMHQVDSPKSSWAHTSIGSMDSPRSSTWTHGTDSPKSSWGGDKPIHTQPLPPLPSTRPRSLGRKLPNTLTESLELLVRVQEHCHKLGAPLGPVPEEASPESPTTRTRRRSQPPATRRSTEPPFGGSTSNLHAVPEGRVSRAPSQGQSRSQTRRTAAPVQLQRTRSASSPSSSSGDWPETPRTSVYSGGYHASESVPVFASSREDLRTPPGRPAMRSLAGLEHRPAMRSVVALDAQPMTTATINYAAEVEVLDEAGCPLLFGDLLTSPRTLVVFVRHWLSPSCANYLRELITALTPPLLTRARARVVIVGHGAANMIRSFRQHLQCPFSVYTDPSRKLHDVLGLVPKGAKAFHLRSAKELLMGAARMGLRGGNRAQMGGLFIFDGHDIVFTHRMRADTDHAPLGTVVDAMATDPPPQPKRRSSHRNSGIYGGSRPGRAPTLRAAQSCASFGDPAMADVPPRLVFPLPPNSKLLKDERRKFTSSSRDCVAVVHPDDIDRISGEIHGM